MLSELARFWRSGDSAVLHGRAPLFPGLIAASSCTAAAARRRARSWWLDAGDDAGGDAEVIPALGEADHRGVAWRFGTGRR